MAVAGLSSLLTEVETAVGASRSDAVDAAVKAFRANAPPLEVIRAAARGVASHYDRTSGVAPRSLAILAAATNLTAVMPPRFQALPVLQSIAYAASEKKASAPAKPPLIVSGEVTHLGRSFLFAVRAGDVAEAESIFLGMVDEGWERKMAGDMLFRATLEDMGEGGRKLFLAVKSWQLARSLGFKESRTILRPAVEYLVKGPRDRTAFETILAVLGKEWVDLDALAAGGRPLDDPGRTKVAAVVSSPSDPACVNATLALLHDGYAASSIAEGFAAEAARRVIGARGYDTEAAKRLLFAHASRFVLTFSRTNERLYALFQAALRVRSPEPSVAFTPPAVIEGEGEELCHVAGEFDARKPAEAAGRIMAYVARGYSTPRMLEVLANYACRDSPRANEGFNLLLADACAAEFLATKSAPVVMALAKMIAASPKDLAAFESWRPLLES
jgi:hypothetical protein